MEVNGYKVTSHKVCKCKKLFWNFSAHQKAWKNYGNNFLWIS
jgi:hypothetical protein